MEMTKPANLKPTTSYVKQVFTKLPLAELSE